MNSMLHWQYDKIIDQLILLQIHAEDPTCPCSLRGEKSSEIGEYCEPKHTRAIVALATETLPMEDDEARKELLADIVTSGRELLTHMEAKLCGGEMTDDVTKWARDKRKPLEEIVYSACGMKYEDIDNPVAKQIKKLQLVADGTRINERDPQKRDLLFQFSAQARNLANNKHSSEELKMWSTSWRKKFEPLFCQVEASELSPVFEDGIWKSRQKGQQPTAIAKDLIPEQAKPLVEEALQRTRDEGIEYGVTLTENPELIKGEESRISFPQSEVATLHTHPSGNLTPSKSDLQEVATNKRKLFCIGGDSQVKCYTEVSSEGELSSEGGKAMEWHKNV